MTSEFRAVTIFVILKAQRIAHLMRKYVYDTPPQVTYLVALARNYFH